MRNYLFSLLLLLLTVTASAQTLAEKYEHIKEDFLGNSYFGANIGAAIPFKEFADNDPTHSTAGYAKTGFTFNFTFRYAFSDFFGLTAKYFSTTNSFDAQKFQNDYNTLATPYTQNTYTYTSDPYTLNGFMIAPTYLIKSRKYNFEFGVGVGKVSSMLPQTSLVARSPTDSVNIFTQSSYQASNWAISVEGAFRYLVAKNVILSAQADALITDQTYKNVTVYLTNNTGYYKIVPSNDYLQPFRVIHLTIGIGFQFE